MAAVVCCSNNHLIRKAVKKKEATSASFIISTVELLFIFRLRQLLCPVRNRMCMQLKNSALPLPF